jgi:hypothetical protein
MAEFEFFVKEFSKREIERCLEIFILLKFPNLKSLIVRYDDVSDIICVQFDKGVVTKREVETEIMKLKHELSA